MITHFNVAQMLVQHRLKTDPNLENQLRATAVVGPTVAEYKISERRGSLSGGGAKRSRSRTSSNGRLLLRLFDDNNNKHLVSIDGSGTQNPGFRF